LLCIAHARVAPRDPQTGAALVGSVPVCKLETDNLNDRLIDLEYTIKQLAKQFELIKIKPSSHKRRIHKTYPRIERKSNPLTDLLVKLLINQLGST